MDTSSVSWLRSLFAWSTREILLIAATGVVFGILMTASLYAFATTVAIAPWVGWAWSGVYLIPSFFIGYVLRKPGAVLLISIIYSLIMLVFSPYGPSILINCAFYASTGEVSIGLGTRYRSFSLPWMLLTGCIAGLFSLLLYLVFYPDSLLDLVTPVLISAIAATIISMIVGAIIAKFLADGVARTGALSGTPLGNTVLQEV